MPFLKQVENEAIFSYHDMIAGRCITVKKGRRAEDDDRVNFEVI